MRASMAPACLADVIAADPVAARAADRAGNRGLRCGLAFPNASEADSQGGTTADCDSEPGLGWKL